MRLHQLVDALDRIFDGKDAAFLRRVQREAVVRAVEAEIGGITGPVADAAIEQRGPQRLVGGRGGAAQRHGFQPGDAGVARREIAPAGIERPDHQFDLMPALVAEADELAHLARRGRIGVATRDLVTGLGQRGFRIVEHLRCPDLERHGLIGRIARHVNKGVVAEVGAEARGVVGFFNELQPEHAGREIDGGGQVAGAETDVAKLFDIDHQAFIRDMDRQCTGSESPAPPRLCLLRPVGYGSVSERSR